MGLSNNMIDSEPIRAFVESYSFLSNFHPSPMRVGELQCSTAEHAYQALKTNVLEERQWVAAASTPGLAKKRGRQITLTSDWEANKIGVMAEVLIKKFEQNPALARQLALTGQRELVEGNYWHDQFWGDCECTKHVNQTGRNMLGKLLMELRTRMAARFE
jgi:ribA/ribD-fused uncharacterized protein